MTVSLVTRGNAGVAGTVPHGARKEWTGASSDTPPKVGDTIGGVKISAADIGPPNSVYYELDTGKVFRWDGLVQWIEQDADLTVLRDISHYLQEHTEQLRAVRRLLARGFEIEDDDN